MEKPVKLPVPGSASLADINKAACDYRLAFIPTDTGWYTEALPSALTKLQIPIHSSSAPKNCTEKIKKQKQK